MLNRLLNLPTFAFIIVLFGGFGSTLRAEGWFNWSSGSPKVDTELVNKYKGMLAGKSELSLSRRELKDNDVLALALALKENTSLKILDVDHNKITAVGATALAEVLAQHNGIKKVNISSNEIGDKGAAAWALVLEKNNSLETINLSNNLISLDGITPIANFTKNQQETAGTFVKRKSPWHSRTAYSHGCSQEK